MKKQEDEIEKLRQRNAALEHETKEMRTAVDDLKYIVFNSMVRLELFLDIILMYSWSN